MVIQGININKHYGSTKALDNVSFSIPKGALTLLVGPNGAGKTTLLRVLAREIFPNSGEIKYLKNIKASSVSFSEENRDFFENFTPLKYAYLWQLIYPLFDREHFMEIMQKREIPVNKSLFQLSKGKRTWLFNALVICSNSSVMLLDEPLQNLDPVVRADFKDMLVKEKEKGRSIVASTHEITEFEEITDNLVIICEGHILIQCEKEKAFLTYRVIPGTETDGDYEAIGPLVNEKLVITGKNIGRKPSLKEIALGYLNGYSLNRQS